MNQKLSIKTNSKYLRLMEWWPKEGQERCSRCCFQKDDVNCVMVCSLCKPSSDDSLTGLETGGFFVESEARPAGYKENRRSFHNDRGFKGERKSGYGRDFKRHRSFDRQGAEVPPRRDGNW